MVLFRTINDIIIFISCTFFIYFNLSYIAQRYKKLGESFFLDEKEKKVSFKKLQYFSLTEKDLGRLNIISAFIFAIAGLYLKIGIFGILFGAIGGGLLPKIILTYCRNKHLKKMNDQLYSSLILLGNALKAGETLPQAIDNIREVVGDPIAQEFAIISRQMRMGMPAEEALDNFSLRVPLEDVELAVRAMNISLKTGSNLPIALKRIAETIRARNTLNSKIDALTIQGKSQGVVVGLLPVFIGGMLYWNDPTYIGILFTTFGGHCVIAVMIVLELMAFLTIKKISTIDI